MDKLKPCPFCGGKGELKRQAYEGNDNIWIQCQNCYCSSRIFARRLGDIPPRVKVDSPWLELVVAAWNRRAKQ